MPTTTPKITLEDLQDAQQNFLNAERAYEEATAKRADTVRGALEAGFRHQAIADTLGVSRGRIGQIAGGRRPSTEADAAGT